jgi:hypothetical protein
LEIAEVSWQMWFLGSSRVWGFVLQNFVLNLPTDKRHRVLNERNVEATDHGQLRDNGKPFTVLPNMHVP